MAGTLLPVPRPQYLDANGDPYSGGKLYIFSAGTTDPLTVYTDIELTTAHAHPIVLGADGRPSSGIYMDAVSAKVRLDDSADVVIWTQDDVPATAVSAAGLFRVVFHFGGEYAYQYTNTAYPTGTRHTDCLIGSAIMNIDSANLTGTFVLEVDIITMMGATASVALVNLTDAPTVAMTGGEVTASSASGSRQRTGAITFPASGATKEYGVKIKTDDATQPVYASGARLLQTA